MEKWEYRVEMVSVSVTTGNIYARWQERLNALGNEGWELVAERYFTGNVRPPTYGANGTLKRPRSDG
jgi:hypothetical protein